MLKVAFHDVAEVSNELLKFAVIVSAQDGKYIFSRHKKRETWEIPGGHREAGEDILETAKRELWEETGAECFDIRPVCVYSVENGGEPTYGMLFFADVKTLGALPADSEIGELAFFENIPESTTYPLIQPHLFARAIGTKTL